MARNPKLSRKRKEYADQRAVGKFVGSPLGYPAGAMEKYEAALGKLTRAMYTEYERELAKTFRQNEVIVIAQDASIASQARITLNKLQRKFASIFSKNAKAIVEAVMGSIDRSAKSSLNESLRQISGGVTLKTDEMPAPLKQYMTGAIAENVNLIKSIAQQYHTQIEGDVMRSLSPGGRGMADVREALEKYKGVTDRRKNLIAKDQVRKATTAIQIERSKSAGIKKFQWLHSRGGSEPRKDHVAMSGNVYSYDDPPIIDRRTGERGFPGQAINCRCQMIPVLEWGEDE